MARKPKTEYRIVCSGKGQPWHRQDSNRTHTHGKKSLAKAQADSGVLNEEGNPTPIGKECQPWHIQKRTITDWEHE